MVVASGVGVDVQWHRSRGCEVVVAVAGAGGGIEIIETTNRSGSVPCSWVPSSRVDGVGCTWIIFSMYSTCSAAAATTAARWLWLWWVVGNG